MPLYDYTATTKEGKEADGVVVADSEELAHDILRERGFYDTALFERAEPSILAMSLEVFRRVPPKALVVFSRQLSVMSAAGVPLVSALRSIGEQTPNARLRATLRTVADDVEGGSRLSDALSVHSGVFSPFSVNMIRSGETSGRLADVLEYLADQEEKDYDLRSKIRGALMYPAFVVSGMIVLGFVMMTFVVPKLTEVLKESGAPLPIPTRILIGVSDFFASYWYLVLIAGIALVVGFQFALKTANGRYAWDAVKLRLPVFGNLFRLIAIVRFSRSMETLLAGGVDTVTSLGGAAEVVTNSVYRDLVLETKREVEDGNSITTVFSTNSVVPSMFTQMLSVGEETGRMKEVLGRLSSFYGREVENSVASMVTLIEPIIMIVMGVAVGVMVAAIILPMYSLASGI